jgi:protochlorophyllide reductase
MDQSRIFIMTGITSGLGLQAARNVLNNEDIQIITGVRSDQGHRALSSLPQDRLTVLDLDLASLNSVDTFCQAVRAQLGDNTVAGLALNAGVQITTGLETTIDGIETAFAVNHLAHWLIHARLRDTLAPQARVVLTCSGTHDPDDPIAKRFGFRGGVFPSAKQVAAGTLDPEATETQACLDRYATSKMCNVMQGLFWARTDRSLNTVLFDPGLMPGTGLARDRGVIERFAWRYLMPVMRVATRGVSSAERSGTMLARLLTGQQGHSGEYLEFTGRTLTPWERAADTALQDDLDAYSERITRDQLAP